MNNTSVRDTSNLMQHRDTRASVSQNSTDKAVDRWTKQLHAREKLTEHHFEHLLTKCLISEPLPYLTSSSEPPRVSVENTSTLR